MIYDSAETIPAKLYFKILEGGDLRLISDDPNTPVEILTAAWSKIESEHNSGSKSKSKELNKVINISKKLEVLGCQVEFVSLALYHLRHKKDDELIDKLKDYGYKFNWKDNGDLGNDDIIKESIYQNDLDRIERESEALEIKINNLRRQLPKSEHDGSDEVPFDETVLMYGAFTGLGYIDPNKLPLTQYDALIINGNKKMKALEKINQSSNKKR